MIEFPVLDFTFVVAVSVLLIRYLTYLTSAYLTSFRMDMDMDMP